MFATRRARTGLFLLTLVALLAVGPVGLAQEIGDPRDAVGQVTDTVKQATGGGGGSRAGSSAPAAPASAPAAAPAAAPSQDDDTGGHETANPQGNDHASGSVLDLDVAGRDILDVGSTNSEIDDRGNASGDVTVLAIGGNEIVGARSDSDGPESDSVAPFDALCQGTDGGVCVGLLFASTTSTKNENQSSSESDAALAFACVGGEQTESDASCDGLVGAGAATSNSQVTQNNQNGDTSAQQETTVADLCLGGEAAEACSGVGVEVLRAESSSEATSQDGPGTTSKESCTADVEVGGEGNCVIEDPQTLEIPPGCLASQSLLCLYLNQGEAFVFTGGAGSRQEALHTTVAPGLVQGSDLVGVHVATAETLATDAGAVGPAGPPNEGVLGSGGGPDGGPGAGSGPPELAFTGMDGLGLLLALLTLAGLGLAALIVERRRAAALV
jgi:hypothetical protein